MGFLWVDVFWFNLAGFLYEFAMFFVQLDVFSCISLGVEPDAVSTEEAVIVFMLDIATNVMILC